MSLTPEATHMLTWLFSPRGIPADYRTMQGFGVNTYKMGQRGRRRGARQVPLGAEAGRRVPDRRSRRTRSRPPSSATRRRTCYDAIERGDYPEWELRVQIMSDDEHPELDFDPLDDTKTWPEDRFPLHAVGRMVLDRNPENYFAEVEQIAFGTGVLVDGLDFSDDKMLVGRTFSYSDTQRYRVGPNYLQLPVNAPREAGSRPTSATGRWRTTSTAPARTRTSNYEPSSLGGLAEARRAGARRAGPVLEGRADARSGSSARTTTSRPASATARWRRGSGTSSSPV